MCVGTCGSLSRRGGKCFQRSHFMFRPFDSFGFKLIKKATRLLRVVFLWHHQRESLRFAVRIVRTKNCVLHVRWHMRLAITPGRKMLTKVAFYIPPVRFLWVLAHKKRNPLVAICFIMAPPKGIAPLRRPHSA